MFTPQNVMSCERFDTKWHLISQIKIPGCETSALKYGALAKLMLSILVIPHGNTEPERLFSAVRKNQTDFRASLNNM